MTLEFTARLGSIPSYPRAESHAREGDLVMLASNETPWAPQRAVLEAVEQALSGLNRYPDPSASTLRRRLAGRHGLPVGRVAVGNGSCELLLAAAEAMLEPGAEVVYAWPSFSMYPHLAAMTGARAVPVGLDARGRHDLVAMSSEVTAATRLLLVCNPNNPTATALDLEEIDAFLASVPRHVCVILDEAYVEFSTLQDPDETLPFLSRHPNLVLLRTFSKVYGLCGLRLGYALGPEEFRLAVDRVRQPFSVNALAQAAGAEAVTHQDEVVRRVERTVAERLHVQAGIARLGLETSASQANFSWVSLGQHDEAEVLAGLASRGVVVRGGAQLGAEGHLRVTYGSRAENDRFLATLAAVLG